MNRCDYEECTEPSHALVTVAACMKLNKVFLEPLLRLLDQIEEEPGEETPDSEPARSCA